ncbi:rod shape-determining protein MreD [Lutibacter sp. A80]|uniref:rod shape-determining protein MreD n=1 Tax=Lutibacter sp. A80 TaxID=2918453 RepID=UPI001F05B268|nr:rod shape-determining protein MreD [Lutibacter sp. A80]UMB62075.1 rod shape-determining protein MreD [Lutibacter sp. A80]
MNNLVLNNLVRFLILILLQVLVLNHINLLGYLNPMVYIVWIFLFPIRKSKTLFLILSFLLGLSIDFFSDSGGINAAATLFIAFIRLPILKIVLKKTDFDYLLFNIRTISFSKSLLFISILTFIHHFIVFSLSYFNFNSYLAIISNTILTSIFTIIISILGIILFTKKK